MSLVGPWDLSVANNLTITESGIAPTSIEIAGETIADPSAVTPEEAGALLAAAGLDVYVAGGRLFLTTDAPSLTITGDARPILGFAEGTIAALEAHPVTACRAGGHARALPSVPVTR